MLQPVKYSNLVYTRTTEFGRKKIQWNTLICSLVQDQILHLCTCGLPKSVNGPVPSAAQMQFSIPPPPISDRDFSSLSNIYLQLFQWLSVQFISSLCQWLSLPPGSFLCKWISTQFGSFLCKWLSAQFGSLSGFILHNAKPTDSYKKQGVLICSDLDFFSTQFPAQ